MNPVEYASIYVLQKGDSLLLQQMMALLGEAFDDREHYSGEPPGKSYHEALLANETFVAITALKNQGPKINLLDCDFLPEGRYSFVPQRTPRRQPWNH
jgi:hypothetical protein